VLQRVRYVELEALCSRSHGLWYVVFLASDLNRKGTVSIARFRLLGILFDLFESQMS
jgi:hypothetical protein